jgi:DNA-binding NarL/FixJ family response regulator
MKPIRVVVVDDHPVVRAGIITLLSQEPGIAIVGEASSGEAALELVRELQPDVLLLDIEMPGIKGYEVARRIREECLPVSILVLSAYEDRHYIQELLSIGASGYLVKEEAPGAIIEAIQRVAQGERGWLSRRVAAQMSQLVQEGENNFQSLTPRERQVLECVASSKTNGEIAHELGISIKTVEKHMVMIFEKLGVSSRVEAAVYSIREGLLRKNGLN